MQTTGHPNATLAAVFGALGTGVVWLLNKYAHTHLNNVDAGLIAAGAGSVRLWVGRRGLKGALTGLWNGTGVTASPPPTP